MIGKEQGSFREPVIFCIHRQTIYLSLNVVSDNGNLVDASVEGFCGRYIEDIANSENIVVFFVLQSVFINI